MGKYFIGMRRLKRPRGSILKLKIRKDLLFKLSREIHCLKVGKKSKIIMGKFIIGMKKLNTLHGSILVIWFLFQFNLSKHLIYCTQYLWLLFQFLIILQLLMMFEIKLRFISNGFNRIIC